MFSHTQETCSSGGGKNEVDPMCGKFHGTVSGDFEAIKKTCMSESNYGCHMCRDLGGCTYFWKTTFVCRLGTTSMMQILGIHMVIKLFLLVTTHRCAI